MRLVVGVDGGDAPAVAVADLIDCVCPAVSGAGLDVDGGVVVAADDEITDAEVLIAGRRARWGRRVGEGVVQAPVERVGDFPGVADQQRRLCPSARSAR